MRDQRRPLVSRKQLVRRQLPQHITTPTMMSDIIRASGGLRPTQAKSLSLGKYVFLTDIIFMFTHSFQLSMFILFHCTIHASLFSFPIFFLMCLKNFEKNQKRQLQLLASLLSMLVVVVIKRKPQKDFSFFFFLLGAFPCKQFFSFLFYSLKKTPKTFQCVSLKFFSFLWGSRGEDD